MAGALDCVYEELASEIRFLRPSCRSRALLPPADLVAFLQRLAASRARDRALVVAEAPEVHCFLALQTLPKGQGADGLNRLQLQVIESLCENSFGKPAPPIAACRKALRTVFMHYDSNEVSMINTVMLLSECAKKGWWNIAKLVVGRLCAHLKAADLGAMEQKVLGTLRDSLVPYGVCCLGVLLEPLHKMIFLHFSALMAQGTAPEVENLPPAIKWYLRLLRKCAGKVVDNGSQTTASTIKESDLDFLFWPFITPFSEMRANFTLQHSQTSSKEARDWSSRYDMKIKSWQDMLIEQLRSDFKMPKVTGLQVTDEEPCYNWLPFAEYALSPDLWIWLHDLLSHSKGSVEDIESRHKRFLETSASGARTLGMGAALVEILAQEMRTCNNHHVLENVQQQPLAESNGSRQDRAADCCGCIHQDAKNAGNAAALLIWLLKPDAMELCDSSWVIIINNLLLATLTTREEFAIQYHDPSGNKHLSDRIDPGLSHEDKIPLQATDSTFITLVQNEKDSLLSKWSKGVNQPRAQRSMWRLEEVIWPALLTQMSCCSYSFTYHRVLESLETFAPRCSEKADDPFPLLQLHVDQFLGVVKLAPRFIIPLMRFVKPGSKIAAVSCFKPGGSVNQDSNFVQLNLCAIQEEEFMAAIHHCVLQESELWVQKQDVLVMQVAAFSGGSFRYLFGEREESVEPIKSEVMRKTNSRIFEEFCAREKGDPRIAGLVAAIEGRRLLVWELRKWTETLQAISSPVAKEYLPKLEALKRIYVWVSALRNQFSSVDTGIAVGLSALRRFLRVQEEDVLWELEAPDDKDGILTKGHQIQTDKGARSAKRPRLSFYTTSTPSSKILEKEREHHEWWIVEALCRSPVSLEKYLVMYLGLDDTKHEGPKRSSKQKTSCEAVCLRRQNLVSYLAKHPSQIPNLASLCRNRKVLQVACEALQEAATNNNTTTYGCDVFEMWLQFLEKFREAGCNVRSITYLHVGTLLARMTECALHHTTVISKWPQTLLENLFKESPAMVRRIYEEARGHIESRLAAHDAAFKELEVGFIDFALSGVVAAMNQNPKAVAQYLESMVVATSSNVKETLQSLQSTSLLDLLSMVFALCKPESRTVVLLHLQESALYKKSTREDRPVLLGQAFVLAVVFWRSKVLKDLKKVCVKHQALSLSEQRAAICHVLLTSEPQLSSFLGGDQRAQTHGQSSCVSGEEMIFQLQAFAPLEENPSLCHAINSWILLYCRMNIRLNLEHIRALCRLHPCVVRDPLIKRIESEIMEAGKVEGELGWKSSLEELKEGLLQGLLAWLPLDGRSHFTTTVDVPSGFWLESNNAKGIREVISCLRSSDIGVRRSAYYLVVAHQHHHHFVSSLILELCNEAISSELTTEQEALLRVLMPVVMREPHTAFMVIDPIIILFRKAKELAFGDSDEGKKVTSSSEPKWQHVKALLRVGLLACEVSPFNFATEEIALLLATLASTVEDPSEEVVEGAVQCLQVLALDLRVTTKHVKLVQDLLLHLVYKPAGDYVWHLALTFAERFAAGVALREEANLGVKENSTIEVTFPFQELLYRCPLQRSIPLQALLKRLDSINSHLS